MASFQTQQIRLACNVNSKAKVLDVTTAAEPEAWWASDLVIAAAAFADAGVTILDVSDIQSATLTLKDPSNLDGSPLFQQTINAFDNTTTTGSWNAGTNQQFLFTLAADSLSFGGLTNGERLLQMSISVVTTGGKTGILGVGTLNLIDAGDESPGSNPVNAITVAQAQALLAAAVFQTGLGAISAGGTLAIGHAQSWLLGWAKLSVAAGAGAYVLNLTLSDANALAGALLRIAIDFGATANPTINIYDSSTGGTLLQTITNPGAMAQSFRFEAGFDGGAWHKETGSWIQ
jgi:hypothetical protein